MQAPVHTMQPGETRTQEFDFYGKLAPGDAITGASVAVEGPDQQLSAGNPTVASPRVFVKFSGGTDGKSYVATVTGNSAAGDVLKLTVQVDVRAGVN